MGVSNIWPAGKNGTLGVLIWAVENQTSRSDRWLLSGVVPMLASRGWLRLSIKKKNFNCNVVPIVLWIRPPPTAQKHSKGHSRFYFLNFSSSEKTTPRRRMDLYLFLFVSSCGPEMDWRAVVGLTPVFQKQYQVLDPVVICVDWLVCMLRADQHTVEQGCQTHFGTT